MTNRRERFIDSKCDRCGRTTPANQNGIGDLFTLPEEWPELYDEGSFCQRCISKYSREDWAAWCANRRSAPAPTASDTHAELAALRDLEELVKRWAAAQYPPPGATTEWVRGALELHYELMRRAGYERPQPSKQED